MTIHFTKYLKIEKHCIAGVSKAQNGTTVLLRGCFSIFFLLSDDTHADVYISTLIVALRNTF